MRTEGRTWNHKRVHRVYFVLRLNLPRRATRRVSKRVRQLLAAPAELNRTWPLDFMGDTFCDGRRVRLLTMLDKGNREALEIAIGLSLPSRGVVRQLDALVAVHGCPSAIRVDNGPEFTAKPFVDWCADHRVTILYIQPGQPDQNAYIEPFNRTYRTEVLNTHLVESVAEPRALTDAWLQIYNRVRPHDSLALIPPLTFLPRPSSGTSLLLDCPLDGDAYEPATIQRRGGRQPARRRLNQLGGPVPRGMACRV